MITERDYRRASLVVSSFNFSSQHVSRPRVASFSLMILAGSICGFMFPRTMKNHNTRWSKEAEISRLSQVVVRCSGVRRARGPSFKQGFQVFRARTRYATPVRCLKDKGISGIGPSQITSVITVADASIFPILAPFRN